MSDAEGFANLIFLDGTGSRGAVFFAQGNGAVVQQRNDDLALVELGVNVRSGRSFVIFRIHSEFDALLLNRGVARGTIYELIAGNRQATLDVLYRIAPEIGTTPGAIVDGLMPTDVPAVLNPQVPSDRLATI